MATIATLNVRLPENLKERGMQVLEREGISVSELIRSLFRELEKTQELPDFARECLGDQAEAEKKRTKLRAFSQFGRSRETQETHASALIDATCANSTYENGEPHITAHANDARNEYRQHLSQKHRPGVRA